MSWMSDDITFCNGIMKAKLNDEIEHEVSCPLKEKCVRFINQPKGDINWWMEAPYSFSKMECENFWMIDRKEKISKRKKEKK